MANSKRINTNSLEQLQRRINERVEEFVGEITELAREAAIEALSSALGGAGAAASPPATQRPAAAAAPAPTKVRQRSGGKRSSEEIAGARAALLDFIHSHPGENMETIGRALGSDTKTLALPAKQLIESGEVITEGNRRATRYYPGSQASSTGAVMPMRRRKA